MITKTLDWKSKESKAKKMSIAELEYAIRDCGLCIYNGVDEEYYSDEASVYYKELLKRRKKHGS